MAAEIAVAGRRLPVPAATVRRAVRSVLDGEGRSADISVTFLGRDRMRRLNREYLGHDRPTDVLAFTLDDPSGALLGDVYVCPWVARREAAQLGVPVRREILRLVVHGTLHVLGYDHPEGADRTDCAMWRLQEGYLEAVSR